MIKTKKIMGVAYDALNDNLYDTKSLPPPNFKALKMRRSKGDDTWYRDDVLRLNTNYDNLDLSKTPLHLEHDLSNVVGKVDWSWISGNTLNIMGQVWDKKTIDLIESGDSMALSIGYQVEPDYSKKIDDISICKVPFFDNCGIRITASKNANSKINNDNKKIDLYNFRNIVIYDLPDSEDYNNNQTTLGKMTDKTNNSTSNATNQKSQNDQNNDGDEVVPVPKSTLEALRKAMSEQENEALAKYKKLQEEFDSLSAREKRLADHHYKQKNEEFESLMGEVGEETGLGEEERNLLKQEFMKEEIGKEGVGLGSVLSKLVKFSATKTKTSANNTNSSKKTQPSATGNNKNSKSSTFDQIYGSVMEGLGKNKRTRADDQTSSSEPHVTESIHSKPTVVDSSGIDIRAHKVRRVEPPSSQNMTPQQLLLARILHSTPTIPMDAKEFSKEQLES